MINVNHHVSIVTHIVLPNHYTDKNNVVINVKNVHPDIICKITNVLKNVMITNMLMERNVKIVMPVVKLVIAKTDVLLVIQHIYMTLNVVIHVLKECGLILIHILVNIVSMNAKLVQPLLKIVLNVKQILSYKMENVLLIVLLDIMKVLMDIV